MKKIAIAILLLILASALPLLANPPQPKILFLGDSLTDGYGVPRAKAYPAIIQSKLSAMGKNFKVVNSGISGSTTASGYRRLKWHLKSPPQILVLALGANDGLRGLKVEKSKKNLQEVISLAKESGIKILLAGMKLPPNYGKGYATRFQKMFFELADKNKIPLIPFLLAGVGGNSSLNQADGIHPNEKGHEVIADHVIKYLEKLL